MEPYVAPHFDRGDLMHLPNWEAIVRARMNGQVLPPFTLTTTRSGGAGSSDMAARAREFSRRSYGQPAEAVRAAIRESCGEGE
jgi:hypothetical protein